MVNSKDAENSLSKTDEKAGGVAEKLGSAIGTAAKWGTAIVGAASAVGGAMVAAAKGTAADLDVIDKASIRMGIAAESYQELAHAAGLSGVEMTTLEKAAKKLVGTDLTFDDALDQLMAITDETERTNAAVEMFGDKVAYDMQPLLAAGADGLAAMKKEANDLGLVMSQETVTNGAAMNDMFSKVEESIATLKNGLMADFMPYVMEILQWVIDNIPTIKETVKGVMDTIVPIVKPIIEAVMAFLPPLMEKIKALIDWLTPYIEPVVSGVFGIINALFQLFQGDLSGFLDTIKESILGIGSALFGIGKDIFTALWDGIKSVWESISGWVSEKVNWLVDKLAFWRSGSDEMSSSGTDGSHASGLAFVPYDGYKAELHRGETVLNADSAQKLLDTMSALANGNSGAGSGTYTININLDGQKLAGVLFDPMQKVANQRGVSYA